MHEPPGNNFLGFPFWKDQYLTEFLTLLEQNQSNYGQITLLTSHSHMDEIRRIQLKNGTKIYAFSTPAVSRIFHNNSGMKLFDLDEHLRVKDFTTYYTSTAQSWGDDLYHAVSLPAPDFPKLSVQNLGSVSGWFE